MLFHSCGVRDTASVLSISTTTVLKTIRQYFARLRHQPSFSLPRARKNVEIDEMWSFVRSKSQQRWLWYAYDRESKTILDFVVGRRTDEACQFLLQKLSRYTIETIHTDNWEAYSKFIAPEQHAMSKLGTQRIERTNLTFRTHLKRLQRRTICFSKSDEIHYAVLSLYIHQWNSS
jgi:insertion element IS1 protein InsB